MGPLFFAIWPAAPASRELARVGESLAERAGGRPMPAQKIHMTLAFLGLVDEGGVGKAAAAAARVRGEEIRMAIDRVGSFPRARVAWAEPSRTNVELAGLQERLAWELKASGFVLEERAFAAHATLARKIERPVPRAPMPPIEWRSRAITLVASKGGRYEVLETWGLK